jgi:hypothetical protein
MFQGPSGTDMHQLLLILAIKTSRICDKNAPLNNPQYDTEASSFNFN